MSARMVRFPSKTLCDCGHPGTYGVCMSGPSAPQQKATLFDHLVGARSQHRRHVEAERLRSLEVDNELVLCGRLNRQVGGLLAPEVTAPSAGIYFTASFLLAVRF